MLAPIINSTATVSAQHVSGYASGTYASVPVFTAGSGAGTSPTLAANANSNDLSGYLTVTTGTSPAASATIATGTFGTAYATLAKCVLWPANAAASALSGTAAAYIPVGANTAFRSRPAPLRWRPARFIPGATRAPSKTMRLPWISRSSHAEMMALVTTQVDALIHERKVLLDRLATLGLGGPLFSSPSWPDASANEAEAH